MSVSYSEETSVFSQHLLAGSHVPYDLIQCRPLLKKRESSSLMNVKSELFYYVVLICEVIKKL